MKNESDQQLKVSHQHPSPTTYKGFLQEEGTRTEDEMVVLMGLVGK